MKMGKTPSSKMNKLQGISRPGRNSAIKHHIRISRDIKHPMVLYRKRAACGHYIGMSGRKDAGSTLGLAKGSAFGKHGELIPKEINVKPVITGATGPIYPENKNPIYCFLLSNPTKEKDIVKELADKLDIITGDHFDVGLVGYVENEENKLEYDFELFNCFVEYVQGIVKGWTWNGGTEILLIPTVNVVGKIVPANVGLVSINVDKEIENKHIDSLLGAFNKIKDAYLKCDDKPMSFYKKLSPISYKKYFFDDSKKPVNVEKIIDWAIKLAGFGIATYEAFKQIS